jgi:UDP-N-acetylglucosamine acyltransferase
VIHPQAVIDPSARIADDVEIGPFCVIGAGVEIDSGTWIGPHVVIQGPTRIGRDNRIFQFASLGEVPQDKKFHGESSRLEIGDRNRIREYCSFNRGTADGGGITRIGNDNWFMAYCHIAHDCIVGDDTVFANAASLAGHVEVDDHVILGGFTTVHQFCRLGAYCFTGQASAITRDVPPYVMVAGNRAKPVGINKEGLRRHGFASETIEAVHRAYRLLIFAPARDETGEAELERLVEQFGEVRALRDFIAASHRGIVR